MTDFTLPPRPQASVLLVDDDPTHQYALCRHLQDAGFSVLQAHTGSETLSLAASDQPDVILLDIQLPDMLGFEVCRLLKESPATNPIPVVFHSATHETQIARERALQLGASAFLSYPIDVDHLINVLRGSIVRAAAPSV